MSHSTHVGFNCPPIWSFRFFDLSGLVYLSCWPVRKSRACGVANFSSSATAHPSLFGFFLPSPEHVSVVSLFAFAAPGVGHIFVNSVSVSGVPLCAPQDCESSARGVGNSDFFTSSARIFPPLPFGRLPGFPARGVGQCATVPKFVLFRFPCVGPVSFQSLLFGVGKYPYPLPQVRSSGVGSGNNSPRRIIPQRGKVPEYDIKPPKSEHWAVLHPYEAGLYLADDPGILGPQSAALAVSDACAFAGGRYVLTGESP